MVKVKICGITNTGDALAAQNAGADFIGFVFADSPRRIAPEKAKSIIEKLSESVKTVALFVNEEKKRVSEIIHIAGRIDILQFHGDEDFQYCSSFDKKVIKAFRVKGNLSIDDIKAFGSVDFILLDAYKPGKYGGTGEAFNWDIADNVKNIDIPLFLSGGLNPDNVNDAVKRFKPFCVDVSSGVEKSPGEKDKNKIAEFIKNARGRS